MPAGDDRTERLGLLAFPMGRAGLAPLRNLIAILGSISCRLHIVTGGIPIDFSRPENNVTVRWIAYNQHANVLGRILSYTRLQLRMAYELASASKDVDTWLFFIGGESLILPLFTAKLLLKKVVLIRAGSLVETLKVGQDKMAGILEILGGAGQQLSDRIVVYSHTTAQSMIGRNLSDKILVARHHYVDLGLFRSVVPVGARALTVGYVGRLDPEKGIREFVRAIPIILRSRAGVRFLIVGDGALREEIKQYLRLERLETVVQFRGWAAHDDIPLILNSIRIMVLPSYTEGLPNIMVESMACGTPVVATPVGSIPDFLKDGITGFLVKRNRPEELAQGVLRALDEPNLEKIAINASALAEAEFSYAKAVEGFRKATQFR